MCQGTAVKAHVAFKARITDIIHINILNFTQQKDTAKAQTAPPGNAHTPPARRRAKRHRENLQLPFPQMVETNLQQFKVNHHEQ